MVYLSKQSEHKVCPIRGYLLVSAYKIAWHDEELAFAGAMMKGQLHVQLFLKLVGGRCDADEQHALDDDPQGHSIERHFMEEMPVPGAVLKD